MALKKPKKSLRSLLSAVALVVLLSCTISPMVYATAAQAPGGGAGTGPTSTGYTPPTNDTCGGVVNGQNEAVQISIDIGCKGIGNPILDATFAIIRFLSDGVGLVIVASLVYAGIQYTGSRGDPQSSALAIKRIRSNVLALFLFIFAYALLNYIVPGQVLK